MSFTTLQHTVQYTTHCIAHCTLYSTLHTVCHSPQYAAHHSTHCTLYSTLHTQQHTSHHTAHMALHSRLHTAHSTVHYPLGGHNWAVCLHCQAEVSRGKGGPKACGNKGMLWHLKKKHEVAPCTLYIPLHTVYHTAHCTARVTL